MISGQNPFRGVTTIVENTVQVPDIAGTLHHLSQLLTDMYKHEQEAKKALQALKAAETAVLKEAEHLQHVWEAELEKHGLTDDLEVSWDDSDEMGDGFYSTKLEASWNGGDESVITALEQQIEHANQHALPVNADLDFAPSEPHGSWFITLNFPYIDFTADLDTAMESM